MRKFNRIQNNVITNSSNESSNESIFCKFGYVDYIILASTIAIALGEELSANDLNILASFFAVLSDELALVSAVDVCNSNDSDDSFAFVPPDVAMTDNIHKKAKNRTIIRKKIVKRKVKRKKNT